MVNYNQPGQLWEQTLPDGSMLIGEKGSGCHTHICNDFVKIKNEGNGAYMGWKL